MNFKVRRELAHAHVGLWAWREASQCFSGQAGASALVWRSAMDVLVFDHGDAFRVAYVKYKCACDLGSGGGRKLVIRCTNRPGRGHLPERNSAGQSAAGGH